MINLFLNLYLTLNHLAKINLLIWHKLAHKHAMGYNYHSLMFPILSHAFLKNDDASLDQFHSDKENLQIKLLDILDNIHELPIH